MLALVLKLGKEYIIVDITNQDINFPIELIAALRNSIIYDREGGTWKIDKNQKVYFDAPHFEISCIPED